MCVQIVYINLWNRIHKNFHILFDILVPIPIFVDNEAESYNQKKPAVTIQELNSDQEFDVDTKKSKYAVRTSSDNQFEMDEINCTNDENIDHNNATNPTTIYSDEIPITACGRPDPR